MSRMFHKVDTRTYITAVIFMQPRDGGGPVTPTNDHWEQFTCEADSWRDAANQFGATIANRLLGNHI